MRGTGHKVIGAMLLAGSFSAWAEVCSGPVDLSHQFTPAKGDKKLVSPHTQVANAALEAALQRFDQRPRDLSLAHALDANVLQMSDAEFARFFLNASADAPTPAFDGRDVSSVEQALLRDGHVVKADNLDADDVARGNEAWSRLLSRQQKSSLSEQEFRRVVAQTESSLLKRSPSEKIDLAAFRVHLFEALGVQSGAFAQEMDALRKSDDPATRALFKRRYPELASWPAQKPLDMKALREKSVTRCDLSSRPLQQYIQKNLCARIPMVATLDVDGHSRSLMLVGFGGDASSAYFVASGAHAGTAPTKIPFRESCRIKELGTLLGPHETAPPLDAAASTVLHEVDLSKKPVEVDGEGATREPEPLH